MVNATNRDGSSFVAGFVPVRAQTNDVPLHGALWPLLRDTEHLARAPKALPQKKGEEKAGALSLPQKTVWAK